MKVYYKAVYVANDGKEFDNQNACIKYEKENHYYAKIKSTLKEVKEICKTHLCDECPLTNCGRCFFKNEDINDKTHCVEPYNWSF